MTRPEYVRGAAWAEATFGGLGRSRAVAWAAAAASSAVALLLAFALGTIGPLNAAVPYAVPVDGLGGSGEAVRGLQPGTLAAEAAIAESHLAQYVAAREGIVADDLPDQWRQVAAWSDRGVMEGYAAGLSRANPASPLVFYPASTVIEPSVRTVSLLSPTTALVRFDTLRRDAGAVSGERRGWQATIAFRFSDAPMRTADRHANPLGFAVTSYRREPDGTLPTQVAFATR